jgi:dTDP-4-amino-4,6-dideoxygalactose transaminase
MHPVLEFARAHGLRVIEDASQAHGATYRGQRVGSFGDVGCFSFYCSKNLGAYGEAGICVTNKRDLAENIRLLRDHGSLIRYRHEVLGTNARLDEVQAAILRVKLRYLEQWNAARRKHALFYTQQLRDVVESVPMVRPWADHVYYVYVVQVQQRDLFRQRMQQAGIATEIHYPTPIHLQPACKKYSYMRGSFPITENVAERIVSLPMYPELTAEQTQAVVDAVKDSIVCEAAHMQRMRIDVHQVS